MPSLNSFGARATLQVDGRPYTIYRLDAVRELSRGNSDRLPFSLKILLENLLRNEDGAFVKREDIEAMSRWDVRAGAEREIAFRTARVLLQDFTGVPAVVDLAAMRDAIVRLGGGAERINPLQPVDLVIDHSVQVDEYGTRSGVSAQHQARVRAEQGALRLSALGSERARELPRRPSGNRHLPPGESRVSRQDGIRGGAKR